MIIVRCLLGFWGIFYVPFGLVFLVAWGRPVCLTVPTRMETFWVLCPMIVRSNRLWI
jgi:hypothetical protein